MDVYDKQAVKMTAVMLVLFALIFILFGCSTAKPGCGTWKDVQRHDSRPFRN